MQLVNILEGSSEYLDAVYDEKFLGRFIAAIGHSGVHVPKTCMRFIKDDQLASLAEDIDHHTDKLYSLSDFGGDMVVSRIHRDIVDVNRSEDILHSSTFSGKRFLKSDYPQHVKEQLMDIYSDFHARLSKSASAMHEKYGKCFILNGHSMAPYDPRTRIRRPGFSIGTNHGKSAEKVMIACICDHIQDLSKELCTDLDIDQTFQGMKGITAAYGRPAEGYSCILLEINQDLYMDPVSGSARYDRIDSIRNKIGLACKDISDQYLAG